MIEWLSVLGIATLGGITGSLWQLWDCFLYHERTPLSRSLADSVYVVGGAIFGALCGLIVGVIALALWRYIRQNKQSEGKHAL